VLQPQPWGEGVVTNPPVTSVKLCLRSWLSHRRPVKVSSISYRMKSRKVAARCCREQMRCSFCFKPCIIFSSHHSNRYWVKHPGFPQTEYCSAEIERGIEEKSSYNCVIALSSRSFSSFFVTQRDLSFEAKNCLRSLQPRFFCVPSLFFPYTADLPDLNQLSRLNPGSIISSSEGCFSLKSFFLSKQSHTNPWQSILVCLREQEQLLLPKQASSNSISGKKIKPC
jgi:hypothetical protein